MSEEKKEENGGNKQDAQLKMINTVFAPDDEHLSELTVLPRDMVLPLSMMETYEEALDEKRTESLSRIWLRKFYKLQRSVGGMLKNQGVALAMEQIGAEEEEEDGDEDDF